MANVRNTILLGIVALLAMPVAAAEYAAMVDDPCQAVDGDCRRSQCDTLIECIQQCLTGGDCSICPTDPWAYVGSPLGALYECFSLNGKIKPPTDDILK